MFLSAKSVDDLLRQVLERLLKSKTRNSATRGETTEITGALLCITNPRARISRTDRKGLPFGCLGELLWYLARSDQLRFIEYYVPPYAKDSEDGKTLHGAYGPRLFNMRKVNQIQTIIDLLRRKPSSRRAVVQIITASDVARKHKEIPCTCMLQFMIRRNRLHLITTMRSNDAFKGLPNDIFAFTMLQEIMARTLGVELGPYKHMVGSLHLYDDDCEKAYSFLNEGWQETVPMPPMPDGDPWPALDKVLSAEKRIRTNRQANIRGLRLDEYWLDLVRLLQIYSGFKRGKPDEMIKVRARMHSHVYDTYIKKKSSKLLTTATPVQTRFELQRPHV